jgi:membrane-associated phospholipid phosphatase
VPPTKYALKGTPQFPQVEPAAGYWLYCPVPCAVPIGEIKDAVAKAGLPPFETDATKVQAEVDELKKKFATRNYFLPQNTLSRFLKHSGYTSRPPVGAVHSPCTGKPFILTGGELARLFEAETPGLWHRHILNVLFDPTISGGLGQRLSPPRQALIWAALDVAISSALSAAWYYKWYSDLDPNNPTTGVSFRPRPVEFDPSLRVLFDYRVNMSCPLTLGPLKNPRPPYPKPSPGTPRHPSYPSGHSTYSAAASEVLGCLIGHYLGSWAEKEFAILANNIGEARLWGGVHYRQDHEAGMLIGREVGKLVIKQLSESGISPTPAAVADPPAESDIKNDAEKFKKNCGEASADFCSPIRIKVDPEKIFISRVREGFGFTDPIPGVPFEGRESEGEVVEDIGFQNPSGVVIPGPLFPDDAVPPDELPPELRGDVQGDQREEGREQQAE